MDGAALGFRDGSFDAVCSSHIIEHFVMPEHHAAELARVCTDDGAAFVITPNRPADFENPFHVYLFEADELASLLRLFFDDVQVIGLEGDDVLQADFAARRTQRREAAEARPARTCASGCRGPGTCGATSTRCPVVYKALGSENTGIGSGLDDSHFFATDAIAPTTPVLFAIARSPRRFPAR